jgi:hypothetical protein
LRNLSFESYNRKPQIPEKIELTPESDSIERCEKVIMEHIFDIEKEKWNNWYDEAVKGAVVKFSEDEDAEAVNDN